MAEAEQRASAGRSRERVLAALRAAGEPLSGRELADRVGLSLTAARFHLGRLIAVGAVRAVAEGRLRPGRPQVLYRAVPAEAVDGGSAYRVLAGVLAAQVLRSGGPDAAVQAGRAWAAEVPIALRGATDPPVTRDPAADAPVTPDPTAGPAADPEASTVQRVLGLLDEGGFEPRLSANHRTIELHRCPFLDLAAERADVVCGVHLGFVQGVLERAGAPTGVRLIPVTDGSGPCLVHLLPRPGLSRQPIDHRATDRPPD